MEHWRQWLGKTGIKLIACCCSAAIINIFNTNSRNQNICTSQKIFVREENNYALRGRFLIIVQGSSSCNASGSPFNSLFLY
jgi:hypothetical protein